MEHPFKVMTCIMVVLIVFLAAATTTQPVTVPPTPTCANHDTMIGKGYQLRSGKYYKLTKTKVDQFRAAKACNADGATLAMFKNSQDFDVVTGYHAEAGMIIWIGVLNPDFLFCNSVASCRNKFTWIDGTKVETSSEAYFADRMDADGAQYCLGMVTSTGRFGDIDCHNQWGYLCQYDCDNPYIEPTCPAAEANFDYVYHDHCYRSYLNEPATYDAAMETCRAQGAQIPRINVRTKYMGAKIMAGFSTQPMWIGLKPNSEDVACDSPTNCNGLLSHHRAGRTADPKDDLYNDFQPINEMADNMMDIDASSGTCITMDIADDTENDNHKLVSANCQNKAAFVCAIKCDSIVCGDPPAAVAANKYSTNWTAEDGNIEESVAM